jgi:hypothetical protein
MRNAPRITMIHWEVRKIQPVWDLLAADAADLFCNQIWHSRTLKFETIIANYSSENNTLLCFFPFIILGYLREFDIGMSYCSLYCLLTISIYNN